MREAIPGPLPGPLPGVVRQLGVGGNPRKEQNTRILSIHHYNRTNTEVVNWGGKAQEKTNSIAEGHTCRMMSEDGVGDANWRWMAN